MQSETLHTENNWIQVLLNTHLQPIENPINCYCICVGNGEELMPVRDFIGDRSMLTAIDIQKPNNNGLARVQQAGCRFIQADAVHPEQFIDTQPDLVIIRNPQVVSVNTISGKTTRIHQNILTLVGNWAETLSTTGQMLVTAYTYEEQQYIVNELTSRNIPPSYGTTGLLPDQYWRIKGTTTVQIPDAYSIYI